MSGDLPDFHIPHAEKIEWMIETNGWAIEVVPPRQDTDPPTPGYTYTVGFPERFGFPEVVVFGLTPADSRGLLDLVTALFGADQEIPFGVPVLGVYDGEQRCVFAPVDLDEWQDLFPTAVAWHRGSDFGVVQMLWPDRAGWLPYEEGYDARLVVTQPVIGDVDRWA